jgi:hypothetical protein
MEFLTNPGLCGILASLGNSSELALAIDALLFIMPYPARSIRANFKFNMNPPV